MPAPTPGSTLAAQADAPAIPVGRRRAFLAPAGGASAIHAPSARRRRDRPAVDHRLAGRVRGSHLEQAVLHGRPRREPAAQRAAPPGHGPVRAGRLGPGRLWRADVAGGRPGGGRDLRRHRDRPWRARRAPRRPDGFPDHARRRHADEHPDPAAGDRVRGRRRPEPVQRRRGHRPTRLARARAASSAARCWVCASPNTSWPPGSSA